MNAKQLILLVIPFFLVNCKPQNTSLYVGTYTNGESEGIYQLEFNTETGTLSNIQLAASSEDPSYLTYSPDKKYVYAVNENEKGTVTSFKVENNSRLSALNTVSTHGAHPCHISANKSGDKVIVSNYTGGNASLHAISKTGSITEAVQVFNHNSENVKSHAHSAQFFKDDLFVSDLGRNSVYHYILKNNTYQLKSEALVETTGNPGPRHFALTKNGEYIYVINEYGASITSIKRINNSFEQIDYDSTLDDNYKGENKCADIHLSKDERFLYGSNRGENTIAVFKRDIKTGDIVKIQNMSVHGDWPRNFTLDPSGKFLLVANKKSNNISVFNIDPETGMLSFLHSTDVPSPVCLLF